MGLVIDGRVEEIPGLRILSWHDNPVLRLNTRDKRSRGKDGKKRRPTSAFVHTTKGIWPQKILPGIGPDLNAEERVARFWSTDPKPSGAQIVIDQDGSAACLADLVTEVAYHATTANEVSIGIELYQGSDGELYEAEYQTLVAILDYVTLHPKFAIARQFHTPYLGSSNPVDRLARGAEDCSGVFGHRDQTDNRGRGDPGDHVNEVLAFIKYEGWNLEKNQDINAWKERQRHLNLSTGSKLPIDGIPGPLTRRALAASGRPHGMWVPRPNDALYAAGMVA